MNEDSRALKRQGALIAIVGPTASGKSTICQRLCSEFGGTISRSVSATSRPRREFERDGEDYFFISRNQFDDKIKQGDFFEWEEVHGNLYGTPKSNVQRALGSGHDVLFAIEIRGALNLKAQLPKHAVIIFLLPPSHEELVQRLKSRSPISEQEFGARMLTLRKEYAALRVALREGSSIDYVVVNDQLDEAYQKVRAILMAEMSRAGRIEPQVIDSITATVQESGI